MEQESIWDSPEYKLAPRDKQGWAFTHKNNYKSAVDAAKEAGIKIDGATVKVKMNNGEMHDVALVSSMYSILPAPKYKRLKHQIDGRYYDVYMVKGSGPKVKSALYFTSQDFDNSEDLQALKKKVYNAFADFKKKHHDMLKQELVKSHAPLAKKAQKELPVLADAENAEQQIFDWFKKNGFEMGHIRPTDFKEFAKELKKSGHVQAHFGVSTKPDNWGHQTGSSVEIDFANKKIRAYGWSSDD